MMRSLLAAVIVLALLLAFPAGAADSFTLWQLPEQSNTQMMSYVMQTTDGKIIVVDGGNAADGPYLKGFLAALGNHVDAWFISHPHSDHVSAVNAILENPGNLEIETFLAALPELDWLKEVCEGEAADDQAAFVAAAEKHGIPVRDLELGETFDIGNVHVKVLGVANPEIHSNCVNNSSLVWKMWDDEKSILFPGDIGAEASEKILAGPYREELKSDYVQMAHHGQAGATEAFYQAVDPQYALWPTPLWLWDVDTGGGKGSGPWKTLEVRDWIEALDVEQNYVTKDGLHRIQ